MVQETKPVGFRLMEEIFTLYIGIIFVVNALQGVSLVDGAAVACPVVRVSPGHVSLRLTCRTWRPTGSWR